MAIKLTFEKESALAALKPFLGLFPDYYALSNCEFSEPTKVDYENYWKYILVQLKRDRIYFCYQAKGTIQILSKCDCLSNADGLPPFWIEFLPFYHLLNIQPNNVVELEEKHFLGFSIKTNGCLEDFRAYHNDLIDFNVDKIQWDSSRQIYSFNVDELNWLCKTILPYSGNFYDWIFLEHSGDKMEVFATDGISLRKDFIRIRPSDQSAFKAFLLPSSILRCWGKCFHEYVSPWMDQDRQFELYSNAETTFIRYRSFAIIEKSSQSSSIPGYGKIIEEYHPNAWIEFNKEDMLHCIDAIVNSEGIGYSYIQKRPLWLHWKNKYAYLHYSNRDEAEINFFVRLYKGDSEGVIKMYPSSLKTLISSTFAEYVCINYNKDEFYPKKVQITEGHDKNYNTEYTIITNTLCVNNEDEMYFDREETALYTQVQADVKIQKTGGTKCDIGYIVDKSFSKEHIDMSIEITKQGLDIYVSFPDITPQIATAVLKDAISLRIDYFGDVFRENECLQMVNERLKHDGFDVRLEDVDYIFGPAEEYYDSFTSSAYLSIELSNGEVISKELSFSNLCYIDEWTDMWEVVGRIFLVNGKTSILEDVRIFDISDLVEDFQKCALNWKPIYNYDSNSVELWSPVKPILEAFKPSARIYISKAELLQ